MEMQYIFKLMAFMLVLFYKSSGEGTYANGLLLFMPFNSHGSSLFCLVLFCSMTRLAEDCFDVCGSNLPSEAADLKAQMDAQLAMCD